MKIYQTPATLFFLLSLCATASAQTTECLSFAPGGQANGRSTAPKCSEDGRFVVWQTQATNFAPGDANGTWDVILLDRATGLTELVSRTPSGQSGFTFSLEPAISANGRFVAFRSGANDIIPGKSAGIYLYDRVQQTFQYASDNPHGFPVTAGSPALSRDGRYVVYTASAPLTPADTNAADDIYRFDRITEVLELVSVDAGGVQAGADATHATVSADGRYIAFGCHSVSWDPAHASHQNCWLKDMQTGSLTCISTASDGSPGNLLSRNPVLSANGEWAAFATVASNIVPLNGGQQIAAKHIPTGAVHHVSISDIGAVANNYCYEPEMSSDGRFVQFRTTASNLHLGGNSSYFSIFLRDLHSQTTRKVSLKQDGTPGSGASLVGSVSMGGRRVIFASETTDMDPADTNGFEDIYMRDRYGDSIHKYGWQTEESIGCVPHIESSGVPSASSGSGFDLRLEDVRGNVPGILIYSKTGPAAVPVLGSYLYVAAPTVRSSVMFSGGTSGACDGLFSFDFNTQVNSDAGLVVGAPVWAQFWSRDVGSASGSHLSDAIAFTLGS